MALLHGILSLRGQKQASQSSIIRQYLAAVGTRKEDTRWSERNQLGGLQHIRR